jgi:hypothetical protein
MKHKGIPSSWWPMGGLALLYVVLLAVEPHPSPFQELYLQNKMAEEGAWFAVLRSAVFPIFPLVLSVWGVSSFANLMFQWVPFRSRWIAIAWGLFILAILATVYLRIYQWIAYLSLSPNPYK